MKKIILGAVLGVIAINAANADFIAPSDTPAASDMATGGFVTEENIITVQQAKQMRDDTDVVLQGRITQRVDDDNKYMFEDETGTITVEIDKKGWRGQNVTPSDKVKLHGEVDRGIFTTEIDVDYIEKM